MTQELRDPDKAVDYIIANASKFAAAKSDRCFLDEYRKSKKAILMSQSPAKSAVEREQHAYSHPEYLQLLDGLKVAIASEEQLKWELVAAQLRVDIWRTRQANNRQQDRATQ